MIRSIVSTSFNAGCHRRKLPRRCRKFRNTHTHTHTRTLTTRHHDYGRRGEQQQEDAAGETEKDSPQVSSRLQQLQAPQRQGWISERISTDNQLTRSRSQCDESKPSCKRCMSSGFICSSTQTSSPSAASLQLCPPQRRARLFRGSAAPQGGGAPLRLASGSRSRSRRGAPWGRLCWERSRWRRWRGLG